MFGAGAIGGLIAGRLALAGHDVTVIARGANLAALQARGLLLRSQGEVEQAPVRALPAGAASGPQDYVFLTTRAHQVPAAATDVARLLGESACLVTASEGIPYWYFHGVAAGPGAASAADNGAPPLEGRVIESVDPAGAVTRCLPPSRTLGCVLQMAASLIGPGEIAHLSGDRLSLGEIHGRRTERVALLSAALVAAGFAAPIRPRIRDEIWNRLLASLCFGPMSVLCGATTARLATAPGLREAARSVMLEARAVAEALGARAGADIDRLLAGAAEAGDHRPSMLHDFAAGRPLEIEPVLGAVVELGTLVDRPTPLCQLLLSLVRERARLRPMPVDTSSNAR